MKEIFKKIEIECSQKGMQRFPTSIEGIQTFDDVKLFFSKLSETLNELNARIEALEKK